MKRMLINKTAKICLAVTVMSLWCLPAYADLDEINQKIIIERTQTGIKIQRNLNEQVKQEDELFRGNDLMSMIRDLIRKTKDSLSSLKWRQTDQLRGSELNRITGDNAQDIIRRNAMIQQSQKRTQQDRMREIKARNRDLNQRIRDLTRR